MDNLEQYLKTVTEDLKKYLVGELKCANNVEIHPGRSDTSAVELLQASITKESNPPSLASSVYTLLIGFEKSSIVETEESDVNIQAVAFILVTEAANSRNLANRMKKVQQIVEAMTLRVQNNKWGLSYAFPAREVKTMDLYGLSYSPDKLVGMQGWNPSIQAYAKDLCPSATEGSPLPNNLSLWAMLWEQQLRISPKSDLPLGGEINQSLSGLYSSSQIDFTWKREPTNPEAETPFNTNFTVVYENENNSNQTKTKAK